MKKKPIVLCVGNCFADQSSLEWLLTREFDVQLQHCDTTAEVMANLDQESTALVLVNRIFDRDGAAGLDLIAHIKADSRYNSIPIMMLSNYAQYQEEAVRLGAEPGFGKSEIHSASTVTKLANYLPRN
ncbi:MAG: hypothetical protein SFX18_08050 [Pirellulales bacterium]|nr:hypothetical protein [Pirellulales bacterium]